MLRARQIRVLNQVCNEDRTPLCAAEGETTVRPPSLRGRIRQAPQPDSTAMPDPQIDYGLVSSIPVVRPYDLLKHLSLILKRAND
jgi:hypothetical protein